MPSPIRQLLSQTSYNADGSTTVWNFSFSSGYLDKAHVKAFYLDAVRVRHDVTITTGMFLGPYQLSIVPAVPNGCELTIYRDTPKDAPLVNFVDKAVFTEASLDILAQQAIFVAAEAVDNQASAIESAAYVSSVAAAAVASAGNAAASAVTAANRLADTITQADNASSAKIAAEAAQTAAALSAASVVRDGVGGVAGLTGFKLNLRNAANTFTSFLASTTTAVRNWTMPDKEGTVALTSDLADYTPSTSLATSTGAALVGWIQTGVGAILRTLLDKMKERISTADFPNTTAGFQQAVTAADGKKLVVNTVVTLNSITIPDTVALEVENGARITVNAGQTLTINGPIYAGNYQIFTSAGVRFAIGAVVKAKWWGTGSQALQRALDSGALYSVFKPGYITVKVENDQVWSSCIDLTTRNSVRIKFAWGVSAVSNSADYIFDCTSMGYSEFINVQASSPSARVGLYLNRGTTRPSAEYNVLDGCSISVASNTAANSGTGTIGLYNSRAELFVSRNSKFYGDVPVILEKKTRAYLLPVYETMQATGTGWDSATVMTFDECTFDAQGNYGPSMYIDDVLGLEAKSCYWRRQATVNGTNNYAIITNNLFRSKLTGSCETWPQFMHTLRQAQFLDIHVAVGAATLNALGIINVDSVSTDVGGIANSNITIESTATAIAGSCVVYGSRPPANTLVTNNTITSNLPAMKFADAKHRLSGSVAANTESDPSGLMVNNIKEYVALGGYVSNAVSWAYTVPAGVGYVEITAAYRFMPGLTDYQTLKICFTRWNGGGGQAMTLSSTTIGGGNNAITYALVNDTITFTSANNPGTGFIGYQVKEYYGDVQ